jgi:hypothetical protein
MLLHWICYYIVTARVLKGIGISMFPIALYGINSLQKGLQ